MKGRRDEREEGMRGRRGRRKKKTMGCLGQEGEYQNMCSESENTKYLRNYMYSMRIRGWI